MESCPCPGTKIVFGVVSTLGAVLYCGGLVYYFYDLSGSMQDAQELGLRPTILGLSAVGVVLWLSLFFPLMAYPDRANGFKPNADAGIPTLDGMLWVKNSFPDDYAAMQWLNAHHVKFVERPIYDTPPSVAELRRMLEFQDGNLRRLFNTSGIEYRAQGLATKLPAMTEAESLALLASNGRLVKRPFLLAAKF